MAGLPSKGHKMRSNLSIFSIAAAFTIVLFSWINPAKAQTIISEGPLAKNGFYSEIFRIGDPLEQSQQIYGRLEDGNYNIYGFIAKHDGQISVKLSSPYRLHNKNFHPQVITIQKGENSELEQSLPFSIPPGLIAKSGGKENKQLVESDISLLEKYFASDDVQIDLKKGKSYYFAIFDPNNNSGDYVLSLKNVDNQQNKQTNKLIDSLKIKLGLVGKSPISLVDFLAFLAALAGLIIGLGAVTVIDIHGWLARKSGYWTEATIRSHKVTKPLIWLGTGLLIIGLLLIYRSTLFSGTAFFHLILVAILILNGLYLTFSVSPRLLRLEKEGKSNEVLPKSLQRKISISFIISFFGWWSVVALFVWHIILTS